MILRLTLRNAHLVLILLALWLPSGCHEETNGQPDGSYHDDADSGPGDPGDTADDDAGTTPDGNDSADVDSNSDADAGTTGDDLDGGGTDDGLPDAGDDPDAGFDMATVNVRIGRPLVVRGPCSDELDTAFSEIRLSNGQCRGFSSNGTSYSIDGSVPWAMGGTRTPVLGPGPAGTSSECGRWLNGTVSGEYLYGFIHVEQSCNYSINQTHKSMELATSVDEGHSWAMQGTLVSGTDVPTAGAITGEGDCTAVDGLDGYYYLYCLRNRDWTTIVARAPASNPFPGNWLKYYQGSFASPGVGGDADALGNLGVASGLWQCTGQVMLLANDPWFGGVKLSLSADKVAFQALPEPLVPVDAANWNRPAATDLIAYLSLFSVDALDNVVGDQFFLTYVYLMPNEGFDKRYLVFRDVTLWLGAASGSPQVGLQLARWYDAANSDRWSTTAPVPGGGSQYVLEGTNGFLLTAPDAVATTNKLEDCVSDWPGHPDHLLTMDGTCADAGYTRLRAAGWVFASPQPDTLPLYRCYNASGQHHFASNDSQCEGLGNMEWLLGYVMAH